MTRARFSGQTWKDLELECEMRQSKGAIAEIALHASGTANGNRVQVGPTFVNVVAPDPTNPSRDRRRPLTGPFPTIREGFAVALGAEIDGVPLHSLARTIADRGGMPSGPLCLGGLPSSSGDRLRRVMLLGSFVAWAIETHGAAKYRDFHFSPIAGDAETPLGELPKLEVDWKAWLLARKTTREERDAAEKQLGLDVMADLTSWRDMGEAIAAKRMKLASGSAGSLEASSAGLDWRGTGAGAGKIELGVTLPETVGVRIQVRLGEGSRVRLIVKERDGRTTTLVLASTGAQLLSPENAIAARSDFGFEQGQSYEVALVLENEAGRIFVDGQLAAEAKGGLSSGPGTAQLECEGRRVELGRIQVRTAD
jgi:hypothetical protein